MVQSVSSRALVVYDQGISQRSRLEKITDEVFRRSLEVAKFERAHLSPLQLDHNVVLSARHRRFSHILPPLTGNYRNIGYKNFVIKGAHERIGIEIFAPTLESNGKKLRTQVNPQKIPAFALSNEQLQTLHTHAKDSLDPIGKMPVLIFSHGLEVSPKDYRPLLEEITSHGYMVIALNHPSSSSYAPFSKNPPVLNDRDEAGSQDPSKFIPELDRLAAIQVDNIEHVVKLVRKKLGKEVPIVLAGHSLGGASSVIASRNDPTIRGCFNIDGGLRTDKKSVTLGDRKSVGLEVPLRTILADHLKDVTPEEEADEGFRQWREEEYLPMLNEWKTLHTNSKDSHIGQIKEINHMDFTTDSYLGWLLGEEDSSLRGTIKAHVVASREIVKFMNSVTHKEQSFIPSKL